MSNNFDTPVLLDTGTGTPAAPGDYVGFGRAAGTAVSTGPRIYAGTGNPNTVLSAPPGSLYLSTNGSVGVGGTLFVNSSVGTGTAWVLASATT